MTFSEFYPKISTMEKYLLSAAQDHLNSKLLLLMEPADRRLCSANKITGSFAYYNYDIKRDIAVFRNEQWDRSKDLVIFDEAS